MFVENEAIDTVKSVNISITNDCHRSTIDPQPTQLDRKDITLSLTSRKIEWQLPRNCIDLNIRVATARL